MNYLKQHNIKSVVLDKKPRQVLELPEETELLGGDEYLTTLENFDILVRSPGLPLSTPQIQVAKKEGVEISSQTKLFFDLCPCPIIGVTGTKGKGTTATLIYLILRKAKKKVFLGGNIGKAPLEFLDKLDKDSIVVLELSSFQLQDLHKSPHIAVVLPVTSDHLDYHKSSKEYVSAKSSIARFQNRKDFVVYNAENKNSESIAVLSRGKLLPFTTKAYPKTSAYIEDDTLFLHTGKNNKKICRLSELKLFGKHNAGNFLAAALATKPYIQDLDAIQYVARNFSGLPHRLEVVGTFKGITYINDSMSTMPDSTIAALDACTEPVVLIAGGSEKHADYTSLGQAIAIKKIRGFVPMSKTGQKIIKAAGAANYMGIITKRQETMSDAIKQAKALAKRGDIILLSPASASFDGFKNAKDRGETFRREVQQLVKK